MKPPRISSVLVVVTMTDGATRTTHFDGEQLDPVEAIVETRENIPGRAFSDGVIRGVYPGRTRTTLSITGLDAKTAIFEGRR